MSRAFAKRNVNFSQNEVWRLLSDLKSPTQYHPYVQWVEVVSSQDKGLGAKRVLHYVDGKQDFEEVVQIGQGYITFKPTSNDDKPGTQFTLTYTVKKILPTWTEIILHANYNLPSGLCGLIQYLFPSSAERRLQQSFHQILEGIEYHLSTQKPVSKSRLFENSSTTKKGRSSYSRLASVAAPAPMEIAPEATWETCLQISNSTVSTA